MSQAIFAIDPGPSQSAWVIWNGERVLDSGIDENWTVRTVLETHFGCKVACEMIASYGMAVGASVFETCVQIGRFEEICNGDMTRIPRGEVKLHICRSVRAKDANVRQALIDRFGPVGTKKNPGPLYGISSHRWAALAVAVTVFDSLTVGEKETK